MQHMLNKQSKTNRNYNITQTKSLICICGLIVLEFTFGIDVYWKIPQTKVKLPLTLSSANHCHDGKDVENLITIHTQILARVHG